MWICWTFLQQVVEKHSFSTGVHPQKFHPPKTKDRYGNPNSCSMVFGWCGFLEHVWIEKSYGVQAGDETRARKYKHLMPQNGVLAKIMSFLDTVPSRNTLRMSMWVVLCVFFFWKKSRCRKDKDTVALFPPPESTMPQEAQETDGSRKLSNLQLALSWVGPWMGLVGWVLY